LAWVDSQDAGGGVGVGADDDLGRGGTLLPAAGLAVPGDQGRDLPIGRASDGRARDQAQPQGRAAVGADGARPVRMLGVAFFVLRGRQQQLRFVKPETDPGDDDDVLSSLRPALGPNATWLLHA